MYKAQKFAWFAETTCCFLSVCVKIYVKRNVLQRLRHIHNSFNSEKERVVSHGSGRKCKAIL